MNRNLLVAILLLAFSRSMFSWGSKGHEITATLTKGMLAGPVLDSVQKYLGETTFEEAAVWMDKVRGDGSFNYMKPWHYINLEKDQTYVRTEKANILNAIESAILNLKPIRRTDKEKTKFNLMVLFHLVGDLHQPLHCGYQSDKGGNQVQVRFLNRGSNLHKVWDSEIIEEKWIGTKNCENYLSKLNAKEREKISQGTSIDWMNESRKLLPLVYSAPQKIDLVYIDKCVPVIEEQLVKSALRLAKILNQIFTK